MEKYIYSGKTEEEALNLAMEDLILSREEMLYCIKNEQKGGIFKSKKVEIEVVRKCDVIEFLKKYLINVVELMGLSVQLESRERDGMLNIMLYSDNNNILIGKNGSNMKALTILAKQTIYNELGYFYSFTLDVGEYKQKREKKLEYLAKKIAKEVVSTKVEVKLDPMNSYERRLVHNALSSFEGIYTESYGEEPERYVVIKPREEE